MTARPAAGAGPSGPPRTRYYRHVIQVEVLTDSQVGDQISDLPWVHRETTDGGASGWVTAVTLNEEVSAAHMAELLRAQGSDPEFLIPPDDPYWEQTARYSPDKDAEN
jgi:hypothetical protein